MIDHDNLEEFADPVSYDLEYGDETGVAFYAALAGEAGGPVLELACGTGRVSIPLARQGFEVTGLDITPGMLDRARDKSAGLPVRWIEGDARAFQLGARFRLIYMTGNAFQAFLEWADQEAMLARVHEHLHPDGLFAFETRNPNWSDLTTDETEAYWHSYTDSHGNEVRVSEKLALHHDPALARGGRAEADGGPDRHTVCLPAGA
jgi:ubiquinone/menaquinone biosynthesis C-methylase UbiE